MGQDNQKATGSEPKSEKVGKYTIVEEIGQGGFADVYRVKDDQGKEFALKKIRKNYTMYGDSSDVATDIAFLSKIDHKFILRLIEGFKDPESDRWCIVTEICERDLRKVIKRKIQNNQSFLEETIWYWFGMISLALDHLHDKKIMHRDLKPENVLLCEDSILKLSDFGIAKYLTTDPTHFSRCGSIPYMAPEVWNRKPYDMKCDVWSLGVMLYELCSLDSNFHQNEKIIPQGYSKTLQDTVKQMLQENPAERPNIKKVCQISELQKNVNVTGGEKDNSQSGSASKQSSQAGKTNVPKDSGYISSPSTSASDNQKRSPVGGVGTKRVKEKSSETTSTQMHESFLSGLDEDRISIIRSDIKVIDIVHSPTTGTIYVRCGDVSGYKWDGQKKTFTHLFTCTPTGDESLVLAPLHKNGTDQLYVSVGYGMKTTKHVYRLGGREMEDKVLLTDTSYIDDKCLKWRLGSDPHKQILLIHPVHTSVIYIHVKEQKHAKVDLNETVEWDSGRWIRMIGLIGRNLLLGVWNESKLYMFDLVVTQEGASIKSDTKWGPVDTYCGIFAALCLPMTNDEQQHKQLHLITTEWSSDDDDKYTILREYRVGLFGVGDVTHGSSNQLDCSSQSTQSLTVRGKWLYPFCVIHEHTSCPVLIVRNNNDKMFAIELDKKL